MSESIFMVMPFSDPVAASAYLHSTKPTAEALGFEIRRADEVFTTNPILDDIVTAIEQSSIVIVDISGRNANCFYELGMAHMLKRNRTVMITHDAFDDVPFDIAHFRILRYQDSIAGKAQYEENLKKTLHSIVYGIPDLYKQEFEVIFDLLSAAEDPHPLFVAAALPKLTKPLRADGGLRIAGSLSKDHKYSASTAVDSTIQPLLSRKVVEIVGDICTLTSKGQAFSKFLSTRGVVVYEVNGEVLDSSHKPVWHLAQPQGDA